MNNIGLAYGQKGDYDNALKCFQGCLGITIKIKGKESIDAANTVNNMSIAYSKKGDLAKALQCTIVSRSIMAKIHNWLEYVIYSLISIIKS